jgi:hypothetical protein
MAVDWKVVDDVAQDFVRVRPGMCPAGPRALDRRSRGRNIHFDGGNSPMADD